MTIDEYINRQTPEQGRILRWLRELILTADPAIREKIGWGLPVYTYRKQHVCYLNVPRSEPGARSAGAVDLTFARGSELPDEAGLLESRGRKTVRSLVIRATADWDEDVIRTYLQEALLLTIPDG